MTVYLRFIILSTFITSRNGQTKTQQENESEINVSAKEPREKKGKFEQNKNRHFKTIQTWFFQNWSTFW